MRSVSFTLDGKGWSDNLHWHSPGTGSSSEDFIINIGCPAIIQEYRHPDFIMNMDETLVYVSMHPTKSVEKIGAKTVNICITQNAGQHATVAVGFTASGFQLKSLVIFKGKPICA